MIQDAIQKRVKEAIAEKVFPGCVIGIVQNDTPLILPFGHFTYDGGARSVSEDTIYDTASITKSIPTGSLALILIDQKKVSLDDQLIQYVPEFSNNYRDKVTIRHLLTYSVEGYGLGAYKDLSSEELHMVIMTKDFESEPGTTFKYTNVPAFLLGLVVERVMGGPLDVLAHKYLFEPLGMDHSTFDTNSVDSENIPPTEVCDWRKRIIQGEIHDESAWTFKERGHKAVGYAGLFSNTPDLLVFMCMLIHRGEMNRERYFSQEIMNEFYTDQLNIPGQSSGLGWEMPLERYAGTRASSRSFAKTGFTGTFFMCDLEKERGLVILSNRTYPKRPPDSSAMNQFRRTIADIVFG